MHSIYFQNNNEGKNLHPTHEKMNMIFFESHAKFTSLRAGSEITGYQFVAIRGSNPFSIAY
jgi:hypothetical protein